jgi:hypothetical protein
VTTPTLFDAVEAREDGIARADAHADREWKEAAFAAVVCAASAHPTFTADQVWPRIPSEFTTHEPAALGPVMLAASRAGLIRKTGEMRASREPRRHRDLVVWCKA